MLDPQSPALTQHYYYRNVTLSMTGATGFWRVWTSKCLAWGKRWRGSSRWDTCLTLWTGLLLVLLKYPCLVLSRASPAGWLWSEMSVCILGTHQWLQWAAHLVCTSCRLLLIGRICQALTDCCPSLTRLSQGCRRQEARLVLLVSFLFTPCASHVLKQQQQNVIIVQLTYSINSWDQKPCLLGCESTTEHSSTEFFNWIHSLDFTH